MKKNLLGSLLISCLCLALASTLAFNQQTDIADQWLARPVDEKTFQAYLDSFAIDDDLSFDTKLLDAEEEEDIRREHLSFQSTPGERVFANLCTPVTTDPAASRPSIILLHGGAASGKDEPGVHTFSEQLVARNGWNVLAIDMEYFGERSTGLMTSYTEKEKHERLYNHPSLYQEWIAQTVKDVRRSFDFLVKEKLANAKRIALIGLSRGAVAGIIAGATEERLAAVVLLWGGHFDAMEKDHLGAACPANYIGRISPRPLLTVNGTRDTDFDREQSVLPLFLHAKPPKEHIWTDGGHGYWTESHQEIVQNWLRNWLKETSN